MREKYKYAGETVKIKGEVGDRKLPRFLSKSKRTIISIR